MHQHLHYRGPKEKRAEKAMATHSSTLAWKIPWMEEPGMLQSMGLLRVRHNWLTSLSLSCTGERNGNPLQCSCLENPRDGRAWWAAINGVAQSQTRLKWLSSSSSEGICLHWIRTCEFGGQFRIWLQTASRQTPGSNFSIPKLCLAN